MKNLIARHLLVVLAATSVILPAWAADPVSDAARVKQQASEIPALQKAAAIAADWEAITVRSAAHQITVTVSGSPLTHSAEREAQASKIVAAVETGIEKKPAFAQISVIHMNYVKLVGQGKSAAQGFDYYQTPAGAFVPHKT